MKKNGIERALEYGKSLTKELSPKIHYLAGYNQAVEDYNSIEADAIQDILLTEIMVLREKNAELVEALNRCHSLMEDASKYYKSKALKKQIEIVESFINSNITK